MFTKTADTIVYIHRNRWYSNAYSKKKRLIYKKMYLFFASSTFFPNLVLIALIFGTWSLWQASTYIISKQLVDLLLITMKKLIKHKSVNKFNHKRLVMARSMCSKVCQNHNLSIAGFQRNSKSPWETSITNFNSLSDGNLLANRLINFQPRNSRFSPSIFVGLGFSCLII